MVDGDGGTMALLQEATPIRIIAHPHAKSFVWQHFGFVPLGDTDTPDRRRVLCRLCLRELPYCGNTTNLQYHLQRYHRDVMPAGLREMRPSPRTARRASRLPDPIGDPGKENKTRTILKSFYFYGFFFLPLPRSVNCGGSKPRSSTTR